MANYQTENNMKRLFLYFVLSFVCSQASPYVFVDGIRLDTGHPYYKNGVGSLLDCDDYNAYYDNGVLILKGYKGEYISINENNCTISVQDDSEIRIIADGSSGIMSSGDLNIELHNGACLQVLGNVNGVAEAIACKGNLYLGTIGSQENGKQSTLVVNTSGASGASAPQVGIRCGGILYVNGDINLDVRSSSLHSPNHAVWCSGFIFDTTGEIYLDASHCIADYHSFAIYEDKKESSVWRVDNAKKITLKAYSSIGEKETLLGLPANGVTNYSYNSLYLDDNDDLRRYDYQYNFKNDIYTVVYTKIEDYDICIADNIINNINCSNLSVFDGVSGTVKYDPATNTLTLQNATITNTSPNGGNNKGYGILNKIDGLTIHLEGENTITSTQWDGLASVGNLTITGNGTLNIDAKGTALGMIGATSYYLTINGGAKVFAKGMYGVYGGMKTVPAAGGQLTESYVTHLRVSGAKTELHVYGTEQCAQLIAFLETDAGMEMRGESGKAYFEQNSFCYFERHRYQPYANQWVTIKYPDGFILGDVNHDGSITMADANAVVNYFLSTDKPEDFDKTTADVNGDGSITMADANAIVNMFLGQ